jgi:O-antigen/teichoic acid export membrane protein
MLPIVTRIVTPADMGYYARAVALAMALSVVLTFRLEAAAFSSLTLGRRVQTAFGAIFVALGASLALGLIVGYTPVGDFVAAVIDLSSRLEVVVVVVVALGLALFTSISNAAAAVQAYDAVAVARPVKQLLELLLLVFLAWVARSSTPLPLSTLAACVVGTVLVAVGIYRSAAGRPFGARSARPRLGSMIAAARRFRRFCIVDLPSAFAVHVSLAIPVVLLSDRFGIAVGGVFALSQRLVNAPVALAAASVGLVFRGELKRHARPDRFFLKCALGLSLFGGAIFGGIAVFPSEWLARLFGPEWAELAPWLPPMAIYGFVRMVAMPLTYALYVAEEVATSTTMQMVHLLLLVIVFVVFPGDASAFQLLQRFVVVEVLFYSVYLLLSYRAAVGLATRPGDN